MPYKARERSQAGVGQGSNDSTWRSGCLLPGMAGMAGGIPTADPSLCCQTMLAQAQCVRVDRAQACVRAGGQARACSGVRVGAGYKGGCSGAGVTLILPTPHPKNFPTYFRSRQCKPKPTTATTVGESLQASLF